MEATKTVTTATIATKKRKQLHYPVLPTAAPQSIDLSNVNEGYDANNVEAVHDNDDPASDNESTGVFESDPEVEANEDGSSYHSSDGGEDDEEDKHTGYQFDGISTVPDCAPNLGTLPIPAKLRSSIAPAVAVTASAPTSAPTSASVSASVSAPSAASLELRKRSKTDLSKRLRDLVSEEISKFIFILFFTNTTTEEFCNRKS